LTVFAHTEIYTERNGRPLAPIPEGTPGELIHDFTPNPEPDGADLALVAFGPRHVIVRFDSLALG